MPLRAVSRGAGRFAAGRTRAASVRRLVLGPGAHGVRERRKRGLLAAPTSRAFVVASTSRSCPGAYTDRGDGLGSATGVLGNPTLPTSQSSGFQKLPGMPAKRE